MNIRAALLGLFLSLGIVAPVLAQSNGPVGLIVGQTPVIGGTSGQCLSIGSNRALNSVACGSGGSGVSTFSAGTTGFTPSTGSTGNVVLNGILNGANGGTGVANTGKTINLGGNLSFPGSFPVTMTATGSTSVVLPTSGTLATVAGTVGTFSAGSTGFTPSTGTPGNVVLGGTLNGASGGTGVSNTGKTITLGGNLITSGGFNTTITVTGDTSVTLPMSGTIATTANTVTSFNGGTTGLVPSSATSGVITLTGTLVGANGGTGVNNSGKTVTLGGNLVTSGAFNTTFIVTADTSVTFPTSGTLATVGGTTSSFSGGTTGLTPGSPSAGAIVLAGTLTGANGGTGVINTGKSITLGGNLTTVGDITVPSTIATLASNTFTGAQALQSTLGVTGKSTLTGMDTIVTLSAPSGTFITNNVITTSAGNADGTTDMRGIQVHSVINGANDVAGTVAVNNQTELQHTTGTVASAIGMDTYVRLGLSTQNPQWAGSATNVYGLRTHIANESALGNITNAYSLYVQAIDLADPVGTPRGTVGFAHGLHVDQQQGQPAGPLLLPGRVTTEAIGVWVGDMNAGAALTASYYTHMQNNSPDQVTYPKYALYFDGSASSVHRGAMNVGDTTDPTGTALFQVRQSLEAQLSSAYFGINELVNFAGVSGGTGDFRGFRQALQLIGANGMAQIDGITSQVTLNSSGGTAALVNGVNGSMVVSGAQSITSIVSNNWQIFHTSDAVVGSAIGYTTRVVFQTGAGTISDTKGISIGEMGGSRVTNTSVAVDISEQTQITGSGIQAGIRSSLSSGGSSTRYNIYANGTAQNILAGKTTIGDTTLPGSATLRVTNTLGTLGTSAALLGIINSSSLTPNSDGASDYRALQNVSTVGGANSSTNLQLQDNQLVYNATAGTATTADGIATFVQQNNAGAITRSRVFSSQFYINGAGNATTVDLYYGTVNFQSGAGTIGTARVVHADNIGGTRIVTEAVSFDAESNSAITGGGINANFRSKNTAGTGKWGFYASGTALNAFNGGVRVGGVTAPVATLDLIGSFAQTTTIGAAPPGTTVTNSFGASLSGDSGGTTDFKLLSGLSTLTGANSVASFIGNINTVTMSHTAGTVNTAKGVYVVLGNTNNGAVTTMRGVEATLQLSSGTGVVTTATGIYGKIARTSGTGTTTTAQTFLAADSGGAYATTAIGYDTEAMSSAGTLTANFRAQNLSGSTRWAFYASGTAASAFNGSVRVGSVVTPVATLDVTGSIAASTTVGAGTTFQSAAPAGASAGLWKLGSLVTAAVVLDTTRSVFVDIGGTVYKLLVAQ